MESLFFVSCKKGDSFTLNREMIFRIGFIVLFFICATLGFAQNSEVVPDLSVAEFNNKVLVTWTVNQGHTCNGVDVFRSTDAVNFIKIGDIEGICGSTDASISYNFTDAFPEKNAINYYRLKLGGLGYTYLVSIEVLDLNGGNYIVRPNPISDATEVLFSNETSKEAVLRVYNSLGILVHTQRTTIEKFDITKRLFTAGIYYFEIETIQRTILGKFLVD